MKKILSRSNLIQALIYSTLCVAFIFLLHKLPFNHLFIDSFGEAIKYHDVTDIGISKFRNHADPSIYDDRLLLLNSEVTNREELTHAIDYLLRNDVAAVGIDLLFDTLYQTSTDTLLAAVLQDPRVVMGYSFVADSEQGVGHEAVRDLVSDPLFTMGNTSRYVNLGTDDGYSVRAFEPFHNVEGVVEPAFAVALTATVDSAIIDDLQERHHEKEWINFRRLQPGKRNRVSPINEEGHIHYPFLSVSQFLQDTTGYSATVLRDKIILIGFSGESDQALSMNDRYYTPLNQRHYGRSLPDMHGVVIHANIISMLLDRDFIEEMPYAMIYVCCFFLFFGNYFLFKKLHHYKLFSWLPVPVVRVLQLLQFVVLFGIAIFLVAVYNFKIGFILMIISVIMSFELYEYYHHRIDPIVDKHLLSSKKQTPS